ncbi:hypothetical protein J7I94_19385 [Streptomyces sp. ISL-12]|uniref:hypothetical protein n=1 Tax=Streptomyces sp. ISL-12 TaxID=2819177 RepID=UPI001BE70E79|nr:hypothetical protein [Streptomyces sp. ISL-12]MBT2412697.1 hypothetical protein [Streptomyces sp. ISL-12]
MIYELADGLRVEAVTNTTHTDFTAYLFDPTRRVLSTWRLTGDEAERSVRALETLDGIRFERECNGAPPATSASPTLKYKDGDVVHVGSDVTGQQWDMTGVVAWLFPDSSYPYAVEIPGRFGYARFAADEVSEPLATTGRPSRLPFRAGLVAASVTTVAAMAVVLAPDAQAPDYPRLKDVVSAPVVTPSPASPSPYRPEPREPRQTTRDEERKTLTPTPSPTIAKPSKTPATKHPIAQPPADIRITFYRDCTGHAQQCIDAGSLTMYAGNILAGHNYDGYQWLSRVPVGRTVRVISGPLAGTYEVYDHYRINRQGGAIPAFPGSPDLVLQSCEGAGTGFSLLRRA